MIVALAGGVGGAKLAHGLARCLPPEQLTVVVNTADDFEIYSLRVCPDLDTVMYTLAGIANPATGWGVAGDSFVTLEMLRSYGEDTWFQIGDKDFATDILRTRMLTAGHALSAVTRTLCAGLGVGPALLPMCDQPVATMIQTEDGELDFQDYFVRQHHQPTVTGVRYRDIEAARPTDEVLAAFAAAKAIIYCPSNPIVSIRPILAVPGMLDALRASAAPKIAVSPIVAGAALRGPADRMLESLGHAVSAYGIAELYADLIQGMVIDEADAALAAPIRALGLDVYTAPTVMRDDHSREALAGMVLEFAASLGAIAR